MFKRKSNFDKENGENNENSIQKVTKKSFQRNDSRKSLGALTNNFESPTINKTPTKNTIQFDESLVIKKGKVTESHISHVDEDSEKKVAEKGVQALNELKGLLKNSVSDCIYAVSGEAEELPSLPGLQIKNSGLKYFKKINKYYKIYFNLIIKV